MKNQYFGENRDLLKFDLAEQILKSGLVERLFYVPMLTPDDPAYQAENICRHESTGGQGNTRLMDFLDYCVINEKRQVAQLENYFRDEGYTTGVYGSQKIITPENRRSYFESVKLIVQDKALILIDPDVGLEEDDSDPGDLLYSEIRDVYNYVDDGSILMFTQRFPRGMYEEYLAMRTAEIKRQIPFSQPVSLDDLDFHPLFLAQNSGNADRAGSGLERLHAKVRPAGRLKNPISKVVPAYVEV